MPPRRAIWIGERGNEARASLRAQRFKWERIRSTNELGIAERSLEQEA
ncbi:hypothetical protein LINPERHAP2_LOCUS36310, partial [Linum perenne]